MGKGKILDVGLFASMALGLNEPGDICQPPLFDDPSLYPRPHYRETAHKRQVGAKWLKVPDEPGVYFVQEQSPQKFIKIGYATHIYDRYHSLASANAYGVILIGWMQGTPKDEKRLHRWFKGCWYRREWFYPTPELLTFIAGLAREGEGGG